MRRYFFDIQTDDGLTADGEGTQLNSFDEAKAEAVGLALDVARECLADGIRDTVIVVVRDEGGDELVRTTVALEIKYRSAAGETPPSIECWSQETATRRRAELLYGQGFATKLDKRANPAGRR